jgi:hypothetical protein
MVRLYVILSFTLAYAVADDINYPWLIRPVMISTICVVKTGDNLTNNPVSLATFHSTVSLYHLAPESQIRSLIDKYMGTRNNGSFWQILSISQFSGFGFVVAAFCRAERLRFN